MSPFLTFICAGVIIVLLVAVVVIVRTRAFYKTKDGSLIRAAERGDTEELLSLLQTGANINSKIPLQHQTALHKASENGHTAVVQILLENGAEVDSRETGNFTPLYTAVRHGHKDVVTLLLEWGANPMGYVSGGITPLYMAASNYNVDIVEMLLAKGAKPRPGRTRCWSGAERGLSKAVVQQLVKETLQSKNPRRCGLCVAVGKGLAKDFVSVFSINTDYSTSDVMSVHCESRILKEATVFVCDKCVKKRISSPKTSEFSQASTQWSR